MTIWRRILLMSALAPASAGATSPPPAGDFLKLYLASSIEANGARDALARADAGYAGQFLRDAASPYSEVTAAADIQNEIAWEDARDRLAQLGFAVTSEQALAMSQWDFGFTKSRAGEEVPSVPASFPSPLIGANAVKAGIEWDIFRQGLDLSPYGNTLVGAQLAVGAQILRARLAAAGDDVSVQESQGLRKDVLDRFLSARRPGDLSDYDTFYLIRIVEGASGRWRAGGLSIYGHREIPTLFRVARVAAGYSLWIQRVGSPCDAQGRRTRWAGNGTEEDTRRPCFNDATDRAVLAWYGRAQAMAEQVRPAPETFMQRLKHAIGRLAGFGVDFVINFGIPEFEFASMAEMAESSIVRELFSEDAVTVEAADVAHERTVALSCGAMK